ncbi:MAG: BMP family ABC transporter substrate-binding protein [Oscillospiraceae bacterium]
MKKVLTLLLAACMVFALVACGNPAPAATGTPAPEATGTPAPAELKIGIILLHNENIGYDFAHISGIKAAQAELGLSDDQILWKYDVSEDENCHDAAVDLAESGCNIIFADSFGHESYMWQAASEYPNVLFCHATGQTAHKSELTNVSNYFTKIYESRYVSGVVAGMKLKELMDAGTVTEPHIGYVGAYPYAEVVSGYTAFFLGIQSIVPEAFMDVTFTNSWADMTAEAAAADALIAKGCVIIGQHADTTGAPSAVQAALDSGKTAYCVGYNVDMLSAAPTAALTSAQNNWGVVYTNLIRAAMNGETLARDNSAGYAEDGVMISVLGPSCAAGTAEKVAEVEAALKSGELHVFDTSKWTVDGAHLETYDKSFGFEGTELIWDGFFHESEVISAPLFDIAVDGITKLN